MQFRGVFAIYYDFLKLFKMKYRIERVKYNDGTNSPWWRIAIYKNGMRYDESEQYSSFLYTLKLWIKAMLFL